MQGSVYLRLFDIQQAALSTLEEHGKGFFSIGVGGGKTLLTMLAHQALSVHPDDVLALTKAKLVKEADNEYNKFKDKLDLKPTDYKSYSWISRNERYFWEKEPKVIVADECHMLANKSSNRTAYFITYMRENPDCVFIPMSGTLTGKSILEYAHLLKFALRDDMPLPDPFSDFGWSRLQSMSRVIDSRPQAPPTAQDYRTTAWELNKDESETYYEAYHRVLASAPGVLLQEGTAFDGPIGVGQYYYELPDELAEAITKIKEDAQLPDDAYVTSETDAANKVKQLPIGFYYQRIYEECHTAAWRRARRERDELITEQYRSEKRKKFGRLTDARIMNAFRSGEYSDPRWDRWEPFADVPEPDVETIVVDTNPIYCTLRFCEALSRETGENILLWYRSRAIRDFLQSELAWEPEACYIAVPGRGDAPPRGADLGDKPTVAAVSLSSHGTGLNLQDYSINVFLQPPTGGRLWEQVLGRTHRPGQEEEVRAYVNSTTRVLARCLDKGKRDAEYVKKTIKSEQKLVLADNLEDKAAK